MSEYSTAKREYKIEACAEALTQILKEYKVEHKKSPTIKKSILFPLLAERVKKNWGKNSHILNGKEIKCPDIKFIRRQQNWQKIRDYPAEEMKTYVTPCPKGIFIGTRADYEIFHGVSVKQINGHSKKVNNRATIINKDGGMAKYIRVQLLLPEHATA